MLLLSARRCCLCFHLDRDFSEQLGQIAHLDQNPSNDASDNLAFLCMKHHAAYDSRSRQHKNYTIDEVKVARANLYRTVELRNSRSWVLVLEGEFSEVDKPRVQALVEHLRTFLGDPHLTIKQVKPGSIRLVIESSTESFRTMERILRESRNLEILGHAVLGLESVREDHHPLFEGSARQKSATNLNRPVRVALAEPESLLRHALRQLLTAPAAVIRDVYGVDVGQGFHVVGEADSADATVALVRQLSPDVLVMDPGMTDGMAALAALDDLAAAHSCRILLLVSKVEPDQVAKSVRLGVRAVITKESTTETLFESITAITSGRYWIGNDVIDDVFTALRAVPLPADPPASRAVELTPREKQILRAVTEGYASTEIAQRLSLSSNSIRQHLSTMLRKVGATSPAKLRLSLLAQLEGPDRVQ